MKRPPGPLSPDDDEETKRAVIVAEELERIVAEHDDWDSVFEMFESLYAQTDAQSAKVDALEERVDAHGEMFKTLFGVDARREATDSVYEDFFPTPTDGRSRKKMERRRALLQVLVRQAGDNGEDKAVLYKKKVTGKSPSKSARWVLKGQDLHPPTSRALGNDLREIARTVPGAKWKQDSETGQNRKALFFNLAMFVDSWQGDE